MYRRNVRRSGCLGLAIALGVFLGIVYFLRDQSPDPSEIAALITPTSTSIAAGSTLTFPTPLPSNDLPIARGVRLLIPRANVTAPVVTVHLGDSGSWNVSQLGFNAGHLEGTAWLGQHGNIVLAGHVEMADGSAGIFAHIDQLTAGDQLLLIEGESTPLVYEVTGVRTVEPDDLSVLYPTETDQLTLITCGEYDLLSDIYRARIVVTSTRQT
ncbi:MAG: class F sortase [Anaerolineae bacterium]